MKKCIFSSLILAGALCSLTFLNPTSIEDSSIPVRAAIEVDETESSFQKTESGLPIVGKVKREYVIKIRVAEAVKAAYAQK